ncbi:MAG: hypothetical protein ACRDU7_10565 [Acidimicrobiia bacterium]
MLIVVTARATLETALTAGGQNQHPFLPFVSDPSDPTQPLLREGYETTLQAATAVTGLSLSRPQSDLASDQTLDEVWVGTAGYPEVALRYESGLRLYITMWPSGADPARSYARLVSESGVGWTTSLGGNPVLAIPKDAQAKGFPPVSVVDISLGDVELSIHADVPVEKLLSVAESVSAA